MRGRGVTAPRIMKLGCRLALRPGRFTQKQTPAVHFDRRLHVDPELV